MTSPTNRGHDSEKVDYANIGFKRTTEEDRQRYQELAQKEQRGKRIVAGLYFAAAAGLAIFTVVKWDEMNKTATTFNFLPDSINFPGQLFWIALIVVAVFQGVRTLNA